MHDQAQCVDELSFTYPTWSVLTSPPRPSREVYQADIQKLVETALTFAVLLEVKDGSAPPTSKAAKAGVRPPDPCR